MCGRQWAVTRITVVHLGWNPITGFGIIILIVSETHCFAFCLVSCAVFGDVARWSVCYCCGGYNDNNKRRENREELDCLPASVYLYGNVAKNLFQCCFYFYLYEYSICVCYYYFGFCCGLLPAARWRTGFFNLNALFSGLLLLLLLQLIDDIFTHPQIVCVYRCLYILFFTKFICYIQVHTCMQLGG